MISSKVWIVWLAALTNDSFVSCCLTFMSDRNDLIFYAVMFCMFHESKIYEFYICSSLDDVVLYFVTRSLTFSIYRINLRNQNIGFVIHCRSHEIAISISLHCPVLKGLIITVLILVFFGTVWFLDGPDFVMIRSNIKMNDCKEDNKHDTEMKRHCSCASTPYEEYWIVMMKVSLVVIWVYQMLKVNQWIFIISLPRHSIIVIHLGSGTRWKTPINHSDVPFELVNTRGVCNISENFCFNMEAVEFLSLFFTVEVWTWLVEMRSLHTTQVQNIVRPMAAVHGGKMALLRKCMHLNEMWIKWVLRVNFKNTGVWFCDVR